jgi:hypothetical protein
VADGGANRHGYGKHRALPKPRIMIQRQHWGRRDGIRSRRRRRETHGECRNCDKACRTVCVLLKRRSLKGCDKAGTSRTNPTERGCPRPRWAHSVLAAGRIECHERGASSSADGERGLFAECRGRDNPCRVSLAP